MDTPVTCLELIRILPATPEEVFAAWTRPELLGRWFAPPPLVPGRVSADARAGGRFQVEMLRPQGKAAVVGGEYEELRPPERLVFTWEFEEMPETRSRVTVLLRSSGGGTQLTLRHERLPDARQLARHREGWEGCLAALETFLGGDR